MAEKEDSKKYRYTKQLINMALRDGWTQKQIADTCRTQQSMVSSWKNGAAAAKESQLKKLLEIYGPRLNRKTFRIYHDVSEDEQGQFQVHMIKVEGELIFSFPYRNKEFCALCRTESSESSHCSCRPAPKKISATRKLLVQALGKGNFCLIQQIRLLNDAFQMEFPETNIFVSKVAGQFTVETLLDFFKLPTEEMNPIEHLMLLMLLKKSLLEHGYPVADVEEHMAAW